MASHWSSYGAHWASLGPPLRPTPGVVAACRSALSAHRGHTLLLGVTPELAALGVELTAVDRSPEMVAAVWPGDGPARRARVGDWRALPLADGACDAALGDGALNTLPDTAAHREVLGELARVLRPGGRAALRVFCRPDAAEAVEAVVREARAGGAPVFHAFKWRVAMALAAAAGGSVAVAAVREAILAADPRRWAAQAGWSEAALATLEIYRGSPERYTFPTEREWLAVAGETFARAALTPVGGYALAERCPLLILDRGVGP